MTKKDFELIASVMKDFQETHKLVAHQPEKWSLDSNWHAWQWLSENLAEKLKSTNPLFDEYKFRKACGIEG